MKSPIPHLLLCLLCLGLTTTARSATCPGSVVTINLASPSGSGTYATPVNFNATASSSAGAAITGYAVYTNQWSDIPFAEGQPMYLNGIATLNAWVILPLTSTGGSLSQDVFVRAWDADGNCGDTATLDITTSGADIPGTFPTGYSQWLNTETDQRNSDSGSGAGWWDCGATDCAGGTNPGTTSIAFDQTPDRDSNGSIEFSLSGAAYADGLFWYKVPPIGEQSSLRNFVWDFYFYLSSDTSTDAQATEFDLFSAINGYKYMIGTQCNYAPPGGGSPIWDAWDASGNSGNGAWVPAIRNSKAENDVGASSLSAISCSKFSTGTWHHALYYLQLTNPDTEYPQGRILYGTVNIDGTVTQWDISAPPVSTTWSDVLGFQHQLDTNDVGSTVTLQEWVDPDNLTAWPQD